MTLRRGGPVLQKPVKAWRLLVGLDVTGRSAVQGGDSSSWSSTNRFGSDGAKIGPGKCLISNQTPRHLLATSSEEAAEVDVFGADHEYDEALTEEQLEENDDAV